MKVTSKDMYRMLREALAPGLKAAGFKRLPGGMLGWTRPARDRHLSFWFQCDKYAWFDDFGSKVTLEFQLADDARAAYGRLSERERFAAFLSNADLELVRHLNNDVIRSLPAPSPTNPVFFLGEEGQKWFMSDYRLRVEPYVRKEDVWLHYFTPQHVQAWGAFFAERIVAMGEAFLEALRDRDGNAG